MIRILWIILIVSIAYGSNCKAAEAAAAKTPDSPPSVLSPNLLPADAYDEEDGRPTAGRPRTSSVHEDEEFEDDEEGHTGPRKKPTGLPTKNNKLLLRRIQLRIGPTIEEVSEEEEDDEEEPSLALRADRSKPAVATAHVVAKPMDEGAHGASKPQGDLPRPEAAESTPAIVKPTPLSLWHDAAAASASLGFPRT